MSKELISVEALVNRRTPEEWRAWIKAYLAEQPMGGCNACRFADTFSDAVIEVWDTPPEHLRELEEQSIRLVLQVEREHWVRISVLFHAEGENRGLYGCYRHNRRPEQPVADAAPTAG